MVDNINVYSYLSIALIWSCRGRYFLELGHLIMCTCYCKRINILSYIARGVTYDDVSLL